MRSGQSNIGNVHLPQVALYRNGGLHKKRHFGGRFAQKVNRPMYRAQSQSSSGLQQLDYGVQQAMDEDAGGASPAPATQSPAG